MAERKLTIFNYLVFLCKKIKADTFIFFDTRFVWFILKMQAPFCDAAVVESTVMELHAPKQEVATGISTK